MKVWAFGDSHAAKFGGTFELVGPPAPTAYGLANEESESQSLFMLRQMLHEVGPEDIVLFVLGEIDCRVHIYRQHILTGKSYFDICKEIIFDCYGRIIKAVRDDNDVNVAVLDIPPATAQENVYELDHYASRDERAKIIFLFNWTLGKWCHDNDVCFVELWPYITDERGWLDDRYAVWDGAHVMNTAVPFVVKELEKCFPNL